MPSPAKAQAQEYDITVTINPPTIRGGSKHDVVNRVKLPSKPPVITDYFQQIPADHDASIKCAARHDADGSNMTQVIQCHEEELSHSTELVPQSPGEEEYLYRSLDENGACHQARIMLQMKKL